MIAAVHHQRSFRAQQTGFFVLLRSCEVAGLRSRGISLRSVRPSTGTDARLRTAAAAACFATSTNDRATKLKFPASTLQVKCFQHLTNYLLFSRKRPFVFNTFRTLSSKNTRGGYSILNLRTKNEANIRPQPNCPNTKKPNP